MQYIIGSDGQPGLTPHSVRDSMSVNRARRIVEDFVPAIIDNVFDNLINHTEKFNDIERNGHRERRVRTIKMDSRNKTEKILCKKCEKVNQVCDITDKTKYKLVRDILI